MELVHKSTALRIGDVVVIKTRKRGGKRFNFIVVELFSVRKLKKNVFLTGKLLDGDKFAAGDERFVLSWVKYKYRGNVRAFKLSSSEAAIYLL
jgi:hypothetical protein